MAFSADVMRSQAPVKCGICKTELPIRWKCIDCDKLLCNNCKEKVHSEFQKAKDHQVVNIKNVGQPTVVDLNINKQYQTELSGIVSMSYCDDGSLWIGNLEVTQRVKPEETKLNKLSSLNIRIYDMAVTQKNNLLVSTGESRLKQICSNTGTLSDTVYNGTPIIPMGVHITSDNKVLVGGIHKDFHQRGRRYVILMNQNGDHERVYEHDQHKQPLFTYPGRMTSTSNGNIHVVDCRDRYRVVVLGLDGDIINIYAGDTAINKRKFYPTDIVTTPRDNVIIADMTTSILYILNNAGILMTYYQTSDIDITYPVALAFPTTGQLYIACCRPNASEEVEIYEVTISEC